MKPLQPIPKGLSPSAQGCEATLGYGVEAVVNPDGVVATFTKGRTQPRWGWIMIGQFSQGSSCLATLGYGPESRLDSPSAQMCGYQRGGLGKAHHLFREQVPA